jgi:hypothetical protein
MFKIFLPLIVAVLPSLCDAKTSNIDKAFFCNMSTTQFFQPLVQLGVLNVKPYAVEDSVSYFHPKFFNQISLFGIQVEAFFGYAENQIMFTRGPGTAPPELYGVIVRESIANVQAQLNANGATLAKVNRIDSNRTAVACLSQT